jgi:hypothetical protein
LKWNEYWREGRREKFKGGKGQKEKITLCREDILKINNFSKYWCLWKWKCIMNDSKDMWYSQAHILIQSRKEKRILSMKNIFIKKIRFVHEAGFFKCSQFTAHPQQLRGLCGRIIINQWENVLSHRELAGSPTYDAVCSTSTQKPFMRPHTCLSQTHLCLGRDSFG